MARKPTTLKAPTPPDFTPLPPPPTRANPATFSRPPWDHGTAEQAIEWALDHNLLGDLEAGAFLRHWREGWLDEWPEYQAWLAAQPPEPTPAAAGWTTLLFPLVLLAAMSFGLIFAWRLLHG